MITTTTNENTILPDPSQASSYISQKENIDLSNPVEVKVKRSYKKKNKNII
jgi:hypothetical protein